jgi:hypothetical protein
MKLMPTPGPGEARFRQHYADLDPDRRAVSGWGGGWACKCLRPLPCGADVAIIRERGVLPDKLFQRSFALF